MTEVASLHQAGYIGGRRGDEEGESAEVGRREGEKGGRGAPCLPTGVVVVDTGTEIQQHLNHTVRV